MDPNNQTHLPSTLATVSNNLKSDDNEKQLNVNTMQPKYDLTPQ